MAVSPDTEWMRVCGTGAVLYYNDPITRTWKPVCGADEPVYGKVNGAWVPLCCQGITADDWTDWIPGGTPGNPAVTIAFNHSDFNGLETVARQSGSTGGDFSSAVVAAIAALTGCLAGAGGSPHQSNWGFINDAGVHDPTVTFTPYANWASHPMSTVGAVGYGINASGYLGNWLANARIRHFRPQPLLGVYQSIRAAQQSDAAMALWNASLVPDGFYISEVQYDVLSGMLGTSFAPPGAMGYVIPNPGYPSGRFTAGQLRVQVSAAVTGDVSPQMTIAQYNAYGRTEYAFRHQHGPEFTGVVPTGSTTYWNIPLSPTIFPDDHLPTMTELASRSFNITAFPTATSDSGTGMTNYGGLGNPGDRSWTAVPLPVTSDKTASYITFVPSAIRYKYAQL